MTTRDFVHKVALVTGTTGIGRAAAIRLASGGARVLACGIDETANAALDAAAAEQGLGLMARRGSAASPERARLRISLFPPDNRENRANPWPEKRLGTRIHPWLQELI